MAKSILERVKGLETKYRNVCCKIQAAIDSLTPNYREFTALVYQTGTGDSEINIGGGTLIKGATYRILGVSELTDFSNVGGPAAGVAIDGDYFIATDDTVNPINYGGASLYLTPACPVLSILKSEVKITGVQYISAGTYRFSSEEFVEGKTTVFVTMNGAYPSKPGPAYNAVIARNEQDTNNSFDLLVGTAGDGALGDDLFQDKYPLSLQIRVYN